MMRFGPISGSFFDRFSNDFPLTSFQNHVQKIKKHHENDIIQDDDDLEDVL